MAVVSTTPAPEAACKSMKDMIMFRQTNPQYNLYGDELFVIFEEELLI